VLLFCDNTTVVQLLRKGTSRSALLMAELRQVWQLLHTLRVELVPVYSEKRRKQLGKAKFKQQCRLVLSEGVLDSGPSLTRTVLVKVSKERLVEGPSGWRCKSTFWGAIPDDVELNITWT
jgi:hypothetical protein